MPLAHLDRASDYELDGDRFESYMARQIKGSLETTEDENYSY